MAIQILMDNKYQYKNVKNENKWYKFSNAYVYILFVFKYEEYSNTLRTGKTGQIDEQISQR